jgi:NTE family protein
MKHFLSARRQASLDTEPQQALRAIGRAAREASTLDGDVHLGLFGALANTAWPAGFRCTVTDTDTGDLAVWDQGSGVPLLFAVASNRVVPMLFATVTINGRSCMDGGLLSHLNATVAPPTDVLVILSCHPLGCEGVGYKSAVADSVARPEAELEQLRQSIQLVVVEHDFSDIDAPTNMMDPNLAVQAFRSAGGKW